MGSLLGRAKFLMGIDANYVLVMKNLGLSWYVGERKIEPYKFFADEGINFARIRLWVGEEGPSRLNYAIKTAKIAQDAGSLLTANIVMLGALFGTELLPIKMATIKETIQAHFPAKVAPVNTKAFDLGYEACRQAVK